MIVDLANLQAWQVVVAILGALGLSPAPWILGLALGRLQFSAPAQRERERQEAVVEAGHARELAELREHFATLSGVKDAAYTDMQTSRDYYRTARLEERDRADKVTDQLAESAGELSKLAAHLLAGLGPKGE